MIERFHILGADNEKIHGYVHAPPAGKPAPLVLLAHGFKGFADYGFLPLMAERLADAGNVVVRFSFSHSGILDDPDHFTRPDLFEKDTFSFQVDDLAALVAAGRDGLLPFAGRTDGSRVALIGHSRGGVSSILAAASIDGVSAVVTLASPCTTLHDEMLKQKLRTLGRVATPSSRTGEELYIGRAIIDDIDRAGDKYDIPRVLKNYPGAFLAVHCRTDDTVPPETSECLAKCHTAGPTELALLDDGSHTFGFSHGQSGSTPALDAAVEAVVKFLNKHLHGTS